MRTMRVQLYCRHNPCEYTIAERKRGLTQAQRNETCLSPLSDCNRDDGRSWQLKRFSEEYPRCGSTRVACQIDTMVLKMRAEMKNGYAKEIHKQQQGRSLTESTCSGKDQR